jgi:sulfite reductase alpha subunit-like flavoprotein
LRVHARLPVRVCSQLTVKVLREPMAGGAPDRIKEGVCSTQLGDLTLNTAAVAFVRPSAFRLPADPAAPIIMIGPGTGIAPFRAFTQQLLAEKARGDTPRTGEVRLYFGCRRQAVDYLYRDELTNALDAGALSAVVTAFSREKGQPKVYVQHRLKEDGDHVHQLMASGAYVYICGATAMGRDVVAVLTELLSVKGGLDAAAAAAAVKRMAAEGRLVQELWS